MAALDCLRGLMLAIVLADHIDFMALNRGTIRNWTLIGLGFSDAADVFVFLSGFVFGLAYGKRIQREGRWSILKHGLFRTLQIYLGFVVCVVCAGLLKIESGTMTWTTQSSEWLANMYLDKQPPNTGILCLYIVLLPWLLLLFMTLSGRLWSVMLGISLALYVFAQIAAHYAWQVPPGWNFQPPGWQFLMVFAAIQGRKFGIRGSTGWPRSRTLFIAAVLVLLLGFVMKKSEWLPFALPARFQMLESHAWTGKSNWPPLRGLHHLSLVYTTVYVIPLSSQIWSNRLLEPLRACGRNSLSIYCVGVVLAQVASNVFRWMGNAPSMVCLMAFDAIAFQCLIALLLEHLGRRKSVSPEAT